MAGSRLIGAGKGNLHLAAGQAAVLVQGKEVGHRIHCHIPRQVVFQVGELPFRVGGQELCHRVVRLGSTVCRHIEDPSVRVLPLVILGRPGAGKGVQTGQQVLVGLVPSGGNVPVGIAFLHVLGNRHPSGGLVLGKEEAIVVLILQIAWVWLPHHMVGQDGQARVKQTGELNLGHIDLVTSLPRFLGQLDHIVLQPPHRKV